MAWHRPKASSGPGARRRSRRPASRQSARWRQTQGTAMHALSGARGSACSSSHKATSKSITRQRSSSRPARKRNGRGLRRSRRARVNNGPARLGGPNPTAGAGWGGGAEGGRKNLSAAKGSAAGGARAGRAHAAGVRAAGGFCGLLCQRLGDPAAAGGRSPVGHRRRRRQAVGGPGGMMVLRCFGAAKMRRARERAGRAPPALPPCGQCRVQ